MSMSDLQEVGSGWGDAFVPSLLQLPSCRGADGTTKLFDIFWKGRGVLSVYHVDRFSERDGNKRSVTKYMSPTLVLYDNTIFSRALISVLYNELIACNSCINQRAHLDSAVSETKCHCYSAGGEWGAAGRQLKPNSCTVPMYHPFKPCIT